MRVMIADATNAVMRRASVAKEMTATEAADDAAARVLRAAHDQGATHLIAAFDDPRGNWRYDVYPDYKGALSNPGQSTAPYAVAMWKALIALGVHCVGVKGFEADDVIATLATRVASPQRTVLILSSDNDLVQLMGPYVQIVQYAATGEKPWLAVRDQTWCIMKFGVEPQSYTDYLALVGGKNNVRGVKGIGAKGAAKLLAEYGTLEALSENGKLDDETLLTATSARHLHRLRTDAPLAAVPSVLCALKVTT